MLKKFLSSFLIIFLFNASYLPLILPKEVIRRKKIEYIFESNEDDEKDFIFLKDRTIVIIRSKFIPLKITRFIFSKN